MVWHEQNKNDRIRKISAEIVSAVESGSGPALFIFALALFVFLAHGGMR